MIDIGNTAGRIWESLKGNEGMSVPALVKATGAKRDSVLMAIGWLLREDKINRTLNKSTVLYSLK